jgi:hypothetical protein
MLSNRDEKNDTPLNLPQFNPEFKLGSLGLQGSHNIRIKALASPADLDGAVDDPEEEAEREEGDLGEESLDNVPPLLGQALRHAYLTSRGMPAFSIHHFEDSRKMMIFLLPTWPPPHTPSTFEAHLSLTQKNN